MMTYGLNHYTEEAPEQPQKGTVLEQYRVGTNDKR